MVFIKYGIIILWTKVASALEALKHRESYREIHLSSLYLLRALGGQQAASQTGLELVFSSF